GVLVTSLITSVIGTFALIAANAITNLTIGSIWLEWFMGDSIGILVLTPLLMLWWNHYQLSKNYRRWLEIILLGICVVAISFLIFQPNAYRMSNYPLTYLTFPFALWAAFRFGARGASTICFVITAVAIVGVAQRLQMMPYNEVHQNLIYLWIFIAIL